MSESDDLKHMLGAQVSIVKGDPKEDTVVKAASNLIQSNAITFEDDLFGQFLQEDRKPGHIKPTYNPLQLSWLVHQNNSLGQAIAAMEVNIDGTGFEIERKDGKDVAHELKEASDNEKKFNKATEDFKAQEAMPKPKPDPVPKEGEEPQEVPPPEPPPPQPPRKEDFIKEEEEEFTDTEVERIKSFFNEPWPGMSFITLRRKLRRDLETQGNAYMEVIRDPSSKEILFLNYLDAKLVRLVKYDAKVPVIKTVTRSGKEIEVVIVENQRRYAQLVETTLVYFKEFGVDRSLDKVTGFWGRDSGASTKGKNDGDIEFEQRQTSTKPNTRSQTQSVVEPQREATELIHFKVYDDVVTPYGVPRWINQVPSILGSRKAEELNLEFFDSGGVPPVMILIQGGQMPENSRKELTAYLAGKAKFKNRAVVAELFSTSGDLNSASQVKVNVERFGAEKQQDSMFEGYDQRCADRLRQAFRLPPIFIGRTDDYTRATAITSYMVGEAQVFAPERDEFDEIINVTIMKELNPEYVFRSKDIGVKDVEEQLKAFEVVQSDLSNTQRVEAINEIASLNLPVPELKKDVDPMAALMGADPMNPAGPPKAAGTPPPFGDPKAVPDPKKEKVAASQEGIIAKMDDDVLVELARDWTTFLTDQDQFESDTIITMKTLINVLGPAPRKLFDAYVGTLLNKEARDPEGMTYLLDCASEILMSNALDKRKGDKSRDHNHPHVEG